MAEKQTFQIKVDQDNKTALEYLSEASGISKQKIKKFMQQGCIWLERNNALSDQPDSGSTNYIQRLRRAKKVLVKGQQLYFYYDPTVLLLEPPKAELAEDFGDYSIWNKPSGMLSQGSKWGDHCTIYRWAEKHLLPERAAFVVHRLDRAANGLIILAHKKHVASLFSRMFEKGEIEKHYLVNVKHDFTVQIPQGMEQITIDTPIDGKTALSHVECLKYQPDQNISQLKVIIETGRKHQIRKHLSGLGFPVIGDRLYGVKGEELTGNENLNLQAQFLRFACPLTGEYRQVSL